MDALTAPVGWVLMIIGVLAVVLGVVYEMTTRSDQGWVALFTVLGGGVFLVTGLLLL